MAPLPNKENTDIEMSVNVQENSTEVQDTLIKEDTENPDETKEILQKIDKKDLEGVTKFDALYIEKKLYQMDKLLGGHLLEQEVNEIKFDPFFSKMGEIKTVCSDVRDRQAKRNKIQIKKGKTPETYSMSNQIEALFQNTEELLKNLNDILRQQYEEQNADTDR